MHSVSVPRSQREQQRGYAGAVPDAPPQRWQRKGAGRGAQVAACASYARRCREVTRRQQMLASAAHSYACRYGCRAEKRRAAAASQAADAVVPPRSAKPPRKGGVIHPQPVPSRTPRRPEETQCCGRVQQPGEKSFSAILTFTMRAVACPVAEIILR